MSLTKEVIEKINDGFNKAREQLERKPFSSLDIGKQYILKKIQFVNSRFGKTVFTTLLDEENNKMFTSFLPKRCVEFISEETVEAMNNSNECYKIIYLGQSEPEYMGAKTRSLLRIDL